MIETIKEAYLDLFLFLKKPIDSPNENQTLKKKTTQLFLILLLDLVIAGICILVLSVLESLEVYSNESHKFNELMRTLPKGVLIFAGVVAVPLIEEVLFRMYLRYKTNYLLRLFVALFYITGKENKEAIEKRIKKAWYKRYVYIFYASAVLFGFVHIFNFDADYKMILLFPIITSPQIFVGIFAGYLRTQYSVIWGYFLHAFHNLIFFLPFIFMGNSVEPLNKNTDAYSIEIEEVSKKKINSKIRNYSDSIYFQEYKLKNIIAFTNNTDKWLIESNSRSKMDKVLNLSYKNKSDSSFVDKKMINKHLQDVYKFKLNRNKKTTPVWELRVEDSLKLKLFKTDSVKGSFVSFSKTNFEIQRGKLFAIAYAIQHLKRKKVFIKQNVKGKYNLKFTLSDSIDFREQLRSTYGLILIDSMASVEHLTVDF